MLTRSRLKWGEGVLEAFNLEIGHAHQREKMADEDYRWEYEKAFYKNLYQMVERVENLFVDYQERLENKKTKKEKAKDNAWGKGKNPSKHSSSSSSSSSEQLQEEE